MSASLAASTPSPQPPSLRLLSADESADESADDAHATNDDARIAALLDRLAPELAADAARNDVDGRFPHENFARLHRAGLIAQVVPRQHGGAGATLAQASGIVAAVARADPATALVLTMTYLQHRALGRADNRWPARVRQAVFDSAVAQGALINALRVEPALGSPSRGGLPETVARRDGD
ncbi:acyl-CoA dehydrogenase family protein, partial [Burkholderia stabilis]